MGETTSISFLLSFLLSHIRALFLLLQKLRIRTHTRLDDKYICALILFETYFYKHTFSVRRPSIFVHLRTLQSNIHVTLSPYNSYSRALARNRSKTICRLRSENKRRKVPNIQSLHICITADRKLWLGQLRLYCACKLVI